MSFNSNAYQIEAEQMQHHQSTPQFFPKQNEGNDKDKLNTISKIYNNQYLTKRSDKRIQRKYPDSLDKRQSPNNKYEQYGLFSQTQYGQINNQGTRNSISNLNTTASQYKFQRMNHANHISNQHLIKNNPKERDNSSQSKIDKVNLINSIYNKDFGKSKQTQKNFTYSRHLIDKKTDSNGNITNFNKNQNSNNINNNQQNQQNGYLKKKYSQQFQPYKSDSDFNKKLGKKMQNHINLNQSKNKNDMTPKNIVNSNKNFASQYSSTTKNIGANLRQNIYFNNNYKSNRGSANNSVNKQKQFVIQQSGQNNESKTNTQKQISEITKNRKQSLFNGEFNDVSQIDQSIQNNQQPEKNLLNLKNKYKKQFQESSIVVNKKQINEHYINSKRNSKIYQQQNSQKFFNNSKRLQNSIQSSRNLDTSNNQEGINQDKNCNSRENTQRNLHENKENIIQKQYTKLQTSHILNSQNEIQKNQRKQSIKNQNLKNLNNSQENIINSNKKQITEKTQQTSQNYEEESFEQEQDEINQKQDENEINQNQKKIIKQNNDEKSTNLLYNEENQLTQEIMNKVSQIQVNRPKTSEGGRRRLKKVKQQQIQQIQENEVKQNEIQLQNLQQKSQIKIQQQQQLQKDFQNQIFDQEQNKNQKIDLQQNKINLQQCQQQQQQQQEEQQEEEIPNCDRNLLANSVNPNKSLKNFKNYKYNQSQDYNKNDWYKNDFYKNKPQKNFFKTTNDFSCNNQQKYNINNNDMFYEDDDGGIEFQIIEEEDVQINQVDPLNLSQLQESNQKQENSFQQTQKQQAQNIKNQQNNRDIHTSTNTRKINQNTIIIRHNKSAYGRKKLEKKQETQQQKDFQGSTLASDFLSLFA
ncbi:hypothetical protein PPERSA_01528 [Pseudocohnilembus persalinus]|uniref:Uncharacterized protein n=1 Tax=Pseudocohnilembus persalinus TaxID=266149 RepID=A0A0V0R7Q3_PSEPJ|nr:hypothetical protein PPERSA_01528 [Pseudocohnilembus persalinus]|eukprot:KRX10516.1 hypothetical protein PPERSA_01528 [Pseudocohnilembus persalinus]